MPGQKPPPNRPRTPSKTPAERGEEFSAIQRQLKQDAADRRGAQEKAKKAENKKS